jgi:hypothetical protein
MLWRNECIWTDCVCPSVVCFDSGRILMKFAMSHVGINDRRKFKCKIFGWKMFASPWIEIWAITWQRWLEKEGNQMKCVPTARWRARSFSVYKTHSAWIGIMEISGLVVEVRRTTGHPVHGTWKSYGASRTVLLSLIRDYDESIRKAAPAQEVILNSSRLCTYVMSQRVRHV